MPDSQSRSEPEPAVEEYPAVRRKFPVPKRRGGLDQDGVAEGFDWRPWATRVLIFAAGAGTGVGGWVLLHPDKPAAAPVAVAAAVTRPAAAPVRTGPPDAAQDIYLTAVSGESVNPPAASPAADVQMERPSVTAPVPEPVDPEMPVALEGARSDDPSGPPVVDPGTRPMEDVFSGTPEPAVEAPGPGPEAVNPPVVESVPVSTAATPVLGDLEKKYLAALERASSGVSTAEALAWTTEIQRVKSGAPLPSPDSSQPAELQRLQAIYRKSVSKSAPAVPGRDPAAREIDLYYMAEDSVTLLLNGEPVKSSVLSGSVEAPGAVQKASVLLKPKDVIGFRCLNKGGGRYFCMVARAGVRQLFGSDERWEASSQADETWLKGQGAAAMSPKVLRGRVDYPLTETARFESLANVHSVDYDVLWVGTEDSAAFRYVIRPVDLPDKPAAK